MLTRYGIRWRDVHSTGNLEDNHGLYQGQAKAGTSGESGTGTPLELALTVGSSFLFRIELAYFADSNIFMGMCMGR